MRETKAAERIGFALSAKLAMALCALAVAVGLVPALTQQAHAAEGPKFVGAVEYRPSYDENGYPEYNADGTLKRDRAYVSLYDIENASGVVRVPDVFDVVVRDKEGNESVVKDVTPYYLYFSYENRDNVSVGWENPSVTGVDLSQCASLVGVGCYVRTIESLDAHGLSRLENMYLGSCEALKSLDLAGTSLKSFTLWESSKLPIPDFSAQEWRNLTYLMIGLRSDFTSFDGSALPRLETLSINRTGLASIDVSACASLIMMDVTSNEFLSDLDVDGIPQTVEAFQCTGCSIVDTDALVARFGERSVLPQSTGADPFKALQVVDPRLANGRMIPGESADCFTDGTYRPPSSVSTNWYREDYTARNNSANYTVESSDESVATIERVLPQSDRTSGWLHIEAVGAGTTTLTIKYSFVGEYDTYEAEQVIDFVVSEKANPIVAVSSEPTAEVAMIASCPFCGESHGDFYETLPLSLTLADPSKPLTSGAGVMVTSSDSEVVTGSFTEGSDEDGCGVSLHTGKPGEATLTIQPSVDGEPVGEPFQVRVTVSDVGAPKLNVISDYATSLFESEFGAGTIRLVGPGDYALASYENDKAAELYGRAHSNSFLYGTPVVQVEGKDITVLSATSSNEAVGTVSSDHSMLQLDLEGVGTTNVTIRDIWGNEGTCAVKTVSRVEEAKKLSLSQSELTIKKGEEFDLSTLVKGLDALDPAIDTGELLLFKTSNGSIAPIAWSKGGPLGYNQVSSILGRNVGDVTVTATMRVGNDGGGSLEYLDMWEVVEFGTLTVHVVDDSQANLATAVEITGDSMVELGSTLQLSATVTPADADNASELAWTSSDEAVAKVDASGKVEPVGVGTAAITASVGAVSDTFEVTVVPRSVPATSVSISGAVASLEVGETFQLAAKVLPEDATDAVAWTSSNEAILQVDGSGLVKAVGVGSAVVTATAGSASASTDAIVVEPATVSVEGVSLNKDAATIIGAGSEQLTATILPAEATNKSVSWSSSDESVATIDASGKVVSVGKGTATITVTTVDGGRTATCEIVVSNPVVKVEVDKTALSLKKGESAALAATYSGTLPGPVDRVGTSIGSSSSGTVVGISDMSSTDGSEGPIVLTAKATALKSGTETLSFAFEPEGRAPAALCVVTVTTPVESIVVNPTSKRVELEGGSTAELQLSAEVAPADADDKGVEWSSDNEGVAVVDANGKVTVRALGEAVITATAKDGSGVSGACTLTAVERVVPATDVTISGAPAGLEVGEKAQLSASVEPSDTTDSLIWSSSDETVLSVDQSGLVTAVGNGAARVKAAAGEASDETAAIEVTTPVSGVTLDASSLELYAGADASKLTATVSPATASNKELAWTSSAPDVASVDGEGNVTPVATGTATVTATTADGGFAASCVVTVRQRVEGVALDKAAATIVGADSIALKATVAPDNATNKNVTWISSDPSVASVDAEGVVIAVGKGQASVTATTEDGGHSASCLVTVSNPVTSVVVQPTSIDLRKGESASLTAALSGALPGATDGADIAWSSSDETVATVDASGVVLARKTGAATIAAKAGDAILATCAVSVTNPVQAVSVSETAKTVTVGEVDSFRLTASVNPSDGDGAGEIAWSSSDEAVATVSSDGVVTVKGAGVAAVTATAGGKSAACALIVKPAVVQADAGSSGFTVSVEVSDPELAKTLQEAQADGGLDLVVDAIDKLTGPTKDAVEILQASGSTIAESFEISFVNGEGEEVTLNGRDGKAVITVKVRMTEAMKALDPDSLKVHFVGDDGRIETKETWADGEYLYFTTEHFSTYVVTGEPPAKGEPEGEGANGKPADKSDEKPSGSSKDTLAATGDAAAPLVAGAVGIATICLAGLIAARRKVG